MLLKFSVTTSNITALVLLLAHPFHMTIFREQEGGFFIEVRNKPAGMTVSPLVAIDVGD